MAKLSFQDWVRMIFASEPGVEPSYSGSEASDPLAPNRRTVEFATQLFQNPVAPLESSSDEQINQGFWWLCANGEGLDALRDELIPWTVRESCIQSFQSLFRDLFMSRCTETLSHLQRVGDETDSSSLNSACYMWWDFDCWVATRQPLSGNRLDAAFLASMASTLALPHLACRESALHGLGHWHWAHPKEVEQIIDDFLASAKRIPEELRQYALAARTGCVL